MAEVSEQCACLKYIFLFLPFCSEPLTGMAEDRDRLNELQKHLAAISKAGTGLIAALASFVAWKYMNADSNPFKEHGATLSILIAATLVHLIFGFHMKNFIHSLSLILSFCICLVSGVIAIELLLFILLTQIWKLLVINVSLVLLISLVFFYKKLASFFSFLLGECFGQTAETGSADGQHGRGSGRGSKGDDVEMTTGAESV